MENEIFEKALKKIAPEEAESLEQMYEIALHSLSKEVSMALTFRHDSEAEAEVKKRYTSAEDNLKYIQQFVIEEAEKLKENDDKKKKEIIDKYLELINDIWIQEEYLNKLSFNESAAKHTKEVDELVDRAKKIEEEYKKINPIPEPTEEELEEIWNKYIE